MKKTKIVPCRGGKIFNKKDSQKISDALKAWESQRKESQPNICTNIPYWKQKSTCAIL